MNGLFGRLVIPTESNEEEVMATKHCALPSNQREQRKPWCQGSLQTSRLLISIE